MPHVFVSYSHVDRTPVSTIVGGLKTTGYEVWWDNRLTHEDFTLEIENALREAGCAVVAWSTNSHDSLWVRAEATAAWESNKLIQLSVDGSKPPLPFTMIHLLDFSTWSGTIGDPSWRHLEDAVASVLKGGISVSAREQRIGLGGLGPIAVLGAASIGLVVIACGMVGMAVTGVFSANQFGIVMGGMFLTALLTFAHMLTRIIKIALASR